MSVTVAQANEVLERAVAALSGSGTLEQAFADAEIALQLARSTGDTRVALRALEVRAQALTAVGDATAEDWVAVERAAREAEAWPVAAGALRMQVMRLLDDHAPDAAAPAARLGSLAAAQAMPADLAWAEAVRAEIALVAGKWDEAAATAMRAVTTAGRAGEIATALRAWHVVIPIAAARGDDVRLSLAFYAYGRRPEGASPYARLLDAAASLRFAGAGLSDPLPVRLDDMLAAFDGVAAMPHWLAAVETIVGGWIDEGDFSAAERALAKMSGAHAGGNASGLGAGVEALLRARLLAAEGAPKAGIAAQGWRALEAFSRTGAPWWVAKAIRALGSAATPALRGQASRIERALGIDERGSA